MTPRPARPGDEQLRRAGPRRDSAPPPSSARRCRRHRRQAGRRGKPCERRPRPHALRGAATRHCGHRAAAATPPASSFSPVRLWGNRGAGEERTCTSRWQSGAGCPAGLPRKASAGRTMGTSDKGKGNTERVTGSPWRTGRDERSETRCRRTRLAPSENVLGRDMSRGRRGGLGRKHSAVWRRPQKLKPLPPPQGTVPSLLDGRGCGKRVCWG